MNRMHEKLVVSSDWNRIIPMIYGDDESTVITVFLGCIITTYFHVSNSHFSTRYQANSRGVIERRWSWHLYTLFVMLNGVVTITYLISKFRKHTSRFLPAILACFSMHPAIIRLVLNRRKSLRSFVQKARKPTPVLPWSGLVTNWSAPKFNARKVFTKFVLIGNRSWLHNTQGKKDKRSKTWMGPPCCPFSPLYILQGNIGYRHRSFAFSKTQGKNEQTIIKHIIVKQQ